MSQKNYKLLNYYIEKLDKLMNKYDLLKKGKWKGRKISLDFEPTQKINEIKETLQEKEGIPKEQIRLIYAGKVLAEESKIEEFKIQPGTVIMMMMHLKGGF